MTALTWDQTGERRYETGVDRGVLYLQDGTAVPWNGLISMEEGSNSELKSYYLDGVKFLENLSPGDFQGKLKAYTYPEEFDEVNGLATVVPGLILTEQPTKSFSLTYRTRIGNDVAGIDYGYKIHILYNLLADPDTRAFDTLKNSALQPIEFVWSLTGTPPKISKFRPTVHVVIDSTKTPPEVLSILEAKLYGSDSSSPSLPPITEIGEFFGYLGALLIIDNGDGSWTAVDESDTYISMIDETTFSITDADVVINGDEYDISSTNVDGGF